MPNQAKVGSWLEGRGSAVASEAYESSESGSSNSRSEAGENSKINARPTNRDDDSDEEAEEKEAERPQGVDWDVMLPKIRPAIMDKSKKRREAFISKYLKVIDDCTSPSEEEDMSSYTIIAPPGAQVPAIFTTLLSALPLITMPDHLDRVVDVVVNLVKRDEQMPEGRLKLADKLVKWISVEVDKVSGLNRT